MRAKTQLFPLNLSDIADTETADYNDDTSLQDVNMNKNIILTAQKISKKYDKIRRKRKRAKSPESIQIEIKTPRTSLQLRSKLARFAAKKIRKI